MDIETTLGTIVQRLDGKTYKLEEIGILTRDFNPSSPSPKHNTEEIDGRHGAIDFGTVYEPRKINCSFYLKAVDMWDYALLRDEVFNIFDSRKPFYIIDRRNPGKRWLVKCNNSYEIDQQRVYGFFEIEFITVNLPFAESVGTTLSPFTFDSELWQVGQGLIAEDMHYKFQNTSFRVYNAGVVAINPKEMPLAIRVYGVTQNLSIINRTTGDVWKYTGETTASDVIELIGVRSLKNGGSIFGKTNYKLINISPGWNEFVISGVTGSFKIEFDFRFYYL
ncbi:phage tail family protein [Bacillus thuringiensis]|uniref:phage tail family protein n=1 Tax=Bacillus thuringiensis TaxID=1428 RepID=UPI003BF769F1